MSKLSITKLHKIIKWPIMHFFVFSMLIPIFLVRLIRPLMHIRFGCINASRLGHFSNDTALYLAEKKKGLHKDYIGFFYFNNPCSNKYLKKKLHPYFKHSRVVEFLVQANKLISGHENHSVVFPCGEDTYDLLKDEPLPLNFSPNEEKLGLETLKRLGIPRNAKFICFSNRESAYLTKTFPQKNWDYHDYRDSNIKNYIPAMKEMVKRGYYVLRMGSVVKGPLEINYPGIIDYSCSKERTDFMDLYLYARCHFAVGSYSGPIDLATSLAKPVAAVNSVVLFPGNSRGFRNTVISPKLFFNEIKGRLMTLNEIIDLGCLNYSHSQEFIENGIKLIENEPEIIKQIVIEVSDRTNGIWKETKKQQDIQNKFWDLVRNRIELKKLRGWPELKTPENLNSKTILWRMGTHFLKENPHLLQ